MKLIVEVSSEIYASIDELIRMGGFRDFNHFLDIACRNQLAAEAGGVNWPSSLRASPTETASDMNDSGGVTAKASALLSVPQGKIATLEPMPPTSVAGSDEPLWGQYYRFLPMKFGARVLANLSSNG